MKKGFFLTLTEGSIQGGMEVYARHIQQAIPSLQVVGRESLAKKNPLEWNWPFFQTIQHGKLLADYMNRLPSPPAFVVASGMDGWALPKSRPYPLFSVLHGTFVGLAENGYSKTSPLYWRMRYIFPAFEKKSAQNALVRVSNSAFTQQEVKQKYGLDSSVIEPPIDSSLFSPGSQSVARKKMGWEAETKHVLFVGNPTYSKGFDIFESLARAHPEWEFHAITSPRVQSLLPNLACSPPLSQAELVTAYRASDALIFASRYEGFGFVPLEALASGCPIITSKVGIFHDFSHERAKIVPHSLDSFDSALGAWIKFPPSRVGKWTDRFSVAVFAKKWKQVIEG